MSIFRVETVQVEVEEHTNADALEIAKVGEFRSIVRKGQFKTGDVAVYIPEASVVPDDVLETLQLTGKLAGPQKNRVKAVRLRGVVSQGIIHPIGEGRLRDWVGCNIGLDVQKQLGIVKYVPPVPPSMGGEVEPMLEATMKYDVDSWKRYPSRITEGTEVVITEKLHGTFCGMNWHPKRGWNVFSKGLGAKGLVFRQGVEANKRNVYCRMLDEVKSVVGFHPMGMDLDKSTVGFTILGEIYGPGIQDLKYGEKEIKFRVFDVWVEKQGFMSWDDVVGWCKHRSGKEMGEGLEVVPVVSENCGWDERMSKGQTLVGNGSVNQIREGIVIRVERGQPQVASGLWGYEDPRPILKVVSEDYLFRKGGTEYE